jgi:hypothetical protein
MCWRDFYRQTAQYPLEDCPDPIRATRASVPPLGQQAGDAGVGVVHEGVGGNDLEPRREVNIALERAVSSNPSSRSEVLRKTSTTSFNLVLIRLISLAMSAAKASSLVTSRREADVNSKMITLGMV